MLIFFIFFSLLSTSYACTSFGVVTSSGTILSKNRDYFYSKQSFKLIEPVKQFQDWYGNNYHHNHKFYALIAKNDVKFGVNEFGLAAIEEDPPYPKQASAHRRYQQPYQGYSEGMVLYGILQNFSTVEEIIPFIDKIFSVAAPNFYQIADKKTILTVEVAYGNSDADPRRQYTYQVIYKSGDYFVHTNTYLTPEFMQLNQLATNKDGIKGSDHRLEKIKNYVVSAKDFSSAFDWYLDTASSVGGAKDPQYCLNTSIFRSYIKDVKDIDRNTTIDSIYGTTSSFMVEHTDNQTLVYVRILDSLHTVPSGDQQIEFKELVIPLDELFSRNKLHYEVVSMLRKAPMDGVCY